MNCFSILPDIKYSNVNYLELYSIANYAMVSRKLQLRHAPYPLWTDVIYLLCQTFTIILYQRVFSVHTQTNKQNSKKKKKKQKTSLDH